MSKINNAQEPLWGYFSLAKNSYCNSKDSFECLDSLQCLNLEKFGNDNLNFAALLINGHNCRFIVDKLYEKIKVEFNGKKFTSLSDSDSIMSYIGNILEKFEQNFFNEMSILFKKKSDLLQTFKSKSELELSKILIEIDKIDNQLKSGATVAISAVIKGRIYISNIGDNQIILVEKDRNNDDIDSKQFLLLTEEHSFHNEREINRIKEDCGLNPDALRWLSMLSQERCHSRCVGDFEMKTQYKQYDYLTNAKSSPLICKSQLNKCIPFQDNFTHILMISSGLFYLVRELIYDTDKVPGEISRKFFELKSQHTEENLTQLCERVIDCFVSDHKKCHEEYLRVMEEGSQVIEFSQHDDLSLFVIDISYQFDSLVIKEYCDGFEVIEPSSSKFMFNSTTDSLNDLSGSRGDTYSSIRSGSNYSLTQISAYVDFSEWDKAMSKLTPEELLKIDLITNIDEPFAPTIAEESESMIISRSTTVDDNKTSGMSDFASMSPEICGLYSSTNP